MTFDNTQYQETDQIFVSGLPQETTEDSFKNWLCENLNDKKINKHKIENLISKINLQYQQDTKRCRGQGHIILKDTESVPLIVKLMNKKVLNGRYIDFELAKGNKLKRKRQLDDEQSKLNLESDALKSKTIFVKNLPQDCSEDDIGDYFSKFGKVRFVRKVQKDGNKNQFKGIAYVEFVGENAIRKCLKEENQILNNRLLQIDIELENKKSGQREKIKNDGNSRQCQKLNK